MSSIVLKIPYESTSFHDAITSLEQTFPVATRAARHELLDRVREWTGVTVALEDAAYIPLKTDWIPMGKVPPRTGDGAKILLAGRWPAEVQRAINAGKTVRIPGTPLEWFWGMMCDVETNHDGPPTDGDPETESALAAGAAAESAVESPAERQGAAPSEGEAAPCRIATYGLSSETDEKTENEVQSEAPAMAPEPVAEVVQPVAEPAAGVPAPEPVIPDEELGTGEPAPESVLPLESVAEMGAASALKLIEAYREQHPHLEIPDTPALELMGREELVAMLTRVVTDPQVVAAWKARRTQLDAGLQAAKERRDYDRFYVVGKKGGIVLLYAEIGAHLRERFNVLTFNKTLYLYDPETGLYIENVGQVESAVQEIAETVGYEGRITQAKREALSYVKDYNVVTEYPFNNYPGIPVANGVIQVDLATGEIRVESHSPEMRFTYKLPVAYDPTASPDAIDTVLRQWVEPDDVPLLYQIPAQAVLHQIGRKKPYKKNYLLHGDQDTGKTTYLELLYCVFGAENCAGVALQRIGLDRFYKGALEGKVFNVYDDLSDVPFDNTGALKALTGGFEHDIERKGRDSYKGRIFAVHVFTCNKPPSVDARNRTDSAFWGRWEYLTFPNSFPRNPAFHDRTFTEEAVSGFFNRVLETAIRIAQTGALLVDSSAFVVRDRWSFNSDPLYRFVQSNLEKDPKGAIPKDDLYEAYLKFCAFEEVDAAKIPANKDVFAKRLFGYDFSTSKQTIEGKRVQIFTGYTWQVSSRFQPGGTDQARIGGV